MPDIARVRTQVIQGMGYELASEAILLTVVPFLFVRLQSSAERPLLPPLSASSCDFYSGYALRLKSISGNECPRMSVRVKQKGRSSMLFRGDSRQERNGTTMESCCSIAGRRLAKVNG
jgi:hypothetical protein